MVQGRVRIVGSVPAGSDPVPVQLESDNPDVASVPESVLIEARASASNPFTVNHRAVATPTPVTITATLTTEGETPQQRSVILTVQPPMVSSITVSQPTVIGKTTSVQGTVTLNGPAPAKGIPVFLTSNNPAIVKVPQNVSVPAGSTTAQFTINTEPVGSPTPVTITASSGQNDEQTTALTVQPPSLTQLTLNQTSVTGGATPAPQGTVQLNGPAPANFVVTLQSTNQAVATVPASITVPTNSTSATFSVSTLPVTSSSQANIVASRAGLNRSAPLTVQPPAPSAFTLSPSPINAGQTSTGTITLSGPAPSGTQVALSGSNTNTADFPATIPVPANNTQVAFNATGKTFTDTDRSVTITASYLGVQRQSPSLTVRRTIALSRVDVTPNSLVGKTASVSGTVTLTGPAPAGGVNVALSSTNPNIVKFVQSNVTVPAGSTSTGFTINTEPVSGSTQFTIQASSQGVTVTTPLTVQPPTPSNFTFNPSTIGARETSTGTITLTGPAPGGTSVSLDRSNTITADFPSSVTVPANATQVTFTATGRFFTTTGSRSVTVTANYLGGSRQDRLTVLGEGGPKDETDFASFEMLTAEDPRSSRGTAATDVEGTGRSTEEAPDSGRPFIRREELPRVSEPTAKPANEQPK